MKTNYALKAEGSFNFDDEQLHQMITVGIIKNRKWIIQYLTKQLFGPELLTSRKVFDKLKISCSTLHRWEKSGIINPIRVGGSKQYAQSEITNLKNQNNVR